MTKVQFQKMEAEGWTMVPHSPILASAHGPRVTVFTTSSCLWYCNDASRRKASPTILRSVFISRPCTCERNNLYMYLFICIWVSIYVFTFCQWIFTIILTLRLFQIWPVEVSVQADFSVLLVLSSFWGKDLYNVTLHRTFGGGGFGGE